MNVHEAVELILDRVIEFREMYSDFDHYNDTYASLMFFTSFVSKAKDDVVLKKSFDVINVLIEKGNKDLIELIESDILIGIYDERGKLDLQNRLSSEGKALFKRNVGRWNMDY